MLKSRMVDGKKVDRSLAGLSRLGLSPNAWTALALAVAIGGFFALVGHRLLLGLLLFLISGALDMVDGAVARTTGRASAEGAFLDGVLDRYVEALLILGIFFYLGPETSFFIPIGAWIAILIFGAVMTSFVRAYADHRGLVKDQRVLAKDMGGLLERAERLTLIYSGMVGALLFGNGWLLGAIVLAAVLSNLTAVQRIFLAIRYGRRG
ncbi:MAG: CDP-alcohol phosphatidyltransferase family protein [Methanothrix sp.]|uniref:CDP-alcohol phosphatidyltransferase n=1 Tax=Methanothrix harundinacea TaxID=301375 RepID=A0A101FST8_9EURY|nr:MAG: CDP-alcohol phosphatidyltransferase [Methanothrix harundinacea]MDD2638614.1 CDP-alcohol phosphatidyltransferase family protein [Methanothrix sp.]MDI9398762.1 CDP-alcohol phosphatidyltransferase family protein [Euryarchaeota archaeon]KUK94676.1 MAG: CDP-alcohol phosphatidyltransferase [Methanothrix harundinacea]MCP1391181.1 CDP-alcohol phosphatidyltransferase family protein [Methanothrix harundinacea]